MSQSGLLTGTNSQRVANGLGSLALNAKLNQAAQAKANDMVARNYWAHNTPDGQAPWVFFQNAGYDYTTAGENLAYGFTTSDATVTAWMNSPPHRENVLGASYTEVGFGFANSGNFNGAGEQTVVVAEYGSPAIASAPATTTPTPAATKPAATPATTATAQAASGSSTPTTSDKPADIPQQQADANTKQNTPESNATAAPNTNATPATITPATTQNITRIQLVSGKQAGWSMFVVSTLAVVCMAIFILRHGLFWHRMLVKGEKFAIHHKVLDITLVAIVVAVVVLTRSAGFIR